jgi:serine/threonine protein kinase
MDSITQSLVLKLKEITNDVKCNKEQCLLLFDTCKNVFTALNDLSTYPNHNTYLYQEVNTIIEECLKLYSKFTNRNWKVISIQYSDFTAKLYSLYSRAFSCHCRVKGIKNNYEESSRIFGKAAETDLLYLTSILEEILSAIYPDEFFSSGNPGEYLTMKLQMITNIESVLNNTGIFSNEATIPIEGIEFSLLDWDPSDLSGLLHTCHFSKMYICSYKKHKTVLKHYQVTSDCLSYTQLESTVKAIRLLSLLKHKNIIHFFGGSVERSIIITELMSCNLFDLIHRNGYLLHTGEILSNETKASLLLDISSAIRFLHTSGIVHGKINSKNIYVSFYGNDSANPGNTSTSKVVAKINAGDLDMFGKDISADSKKIRFKDSYYSAYDSPELSHTQVRTFQSDIYAFGVTAREVVTECEVNNVNDYLEWLRSKADSSAHTKTILTAVGDSKNGCLHVNPHKRSYISHICETLTKLVKGEVYVTTTQKQIRSKIENILLSSNPSHLLYNVPDTRHSNKNSIFNESSSKQEILNVRIN